jgi:hypothetical protein
MPHSDDPEAFLRHVSDALTAWTPAHRAAFVALVAERHGGNLRDYADWRIGDRATAVEMIETLSKAAAGERPAPETLDRYLLDLQELGVLVDPDRFFATDAYRAIGVLKEAIRCCAAGAPPDAAQAVATAALASAASTDLVPDGLQRAWAWDSVRAEVRWLERVIETLGAEAALDADAVRRLRAT